MTKYREILRLYALEFSERSIALSCSVSRNTVSKIIKATVEKGIAWPLDDSQTDKVVEETLFPKDESDNTTDRLMPDFAYILKELLRNGVTKNLFGQITVNCAVWTIRNLSCTHHSATTPNRMSRNAAPPCISHENQESRWKLTGPTIQLTSQLLTPMRLPMHGSLQELDPTASMLRSRLVCSARR